MTKLHENLEFLVEEYGPPVGGVSLNTDQIHRLEKVLPSSLMKFLQIYGFGAIHDGLFQLCDPKVMKPILTLLFANDENFDQEDCQVLGYTAFGDLYCWSNKLYNFTIHLAECAVYCRALTTKNWSPQASANFIASGMIPDPEDSDFLDMAGNPMFEACQKQYGQLESGECFGFFPALAVAGAHSTFRNVQHIQKVSALEHFTILAQLDTFYLMGFRPDGDVVPIRPIRG